MAAERKTYRRITDKEREVLVRYYDQGMVSKASGFSNVIEEAAKETGLSVEQVKKWIGNWTRKIRNENPVEEISGSSTKKMKLPSYSKQASGYNLFCGEKFAELRGSLSEKNKAVALSWSNLSQEEKKAFNDKAKDFAQPDQLSPQDKARVVEKHLKQLTTQVSFLEEMGCEFAGIFLMPSGEVCHLGSTAGQHFLNNNPDVDLKFREHFACPKTPKYREEDVTRLFQKKYSELFGHPCMQVPWKRGNLCAEGMPEGISLKKACFYGSKQIQAIMKEANNINFRFKESSTGNEPDCESPDLNDATQSSPPSVHTQAITTDHPSLNAQIDKVEAKAVLSEVVGQETATRILDGGQLIQESEVEVIEFSLPQDLFLKLHLCLHHFTDEALMSVYANIAHSSVVGGLILAVYTTDEDEKFWLFYTEDYSPSKIAALKNQKSRARIWGRWFDLDPSNDGYTLQQTKSYITTKNIIESKAGFVYYQQDLTHNQVYKLPSAMRAAIFSILASQGYI